MDVPKMFPEIRMRRKKLMFDYEPLDEIRSLTAEEKFKSDFFDTLVDWAISSVATRFEQIRKSFKLFGFLCNAETMRSLYRERTLRAHCKEFELKMGDIHAEDLEMELNRFVCFHTTSTNTNSMKFIQLLRMFSGTQ